MKVIKRVDLKKAQFRNKDQIKRVDGKKLSQKYLIKKNKALKDVLIINIIH